jgi:hypothetical protein
MTNMLREHPIDTLLLVVGDVPDHRALSEDRPSQIAVLAESGLFGQIQIADLNDDQVEFAALAVRELPVAAVEFADVPHGDHVDAALVLTIMYGPRTKATITCPPCGVASVEGMRLTQWMSRRRIALVSRVWASDPRSFRPPACARTRRQRAGT